MKGQHEGPCGDGKVWIVTAKDLVVILYYGKW
jgi:hypothetical protein